jgi:membrane-anchored protein YejM (alkaline phosphatase superfamily)
MRLESINPLVPSGYDIAWALVGVVVVAALAAAILMALWSIMRSTRLTAAGRVLWVLVVFALPVLGTAAWFAWGRDARLERGTV